MTLRGAGRDDAREGASEAVRTAESQPRDKRILLSDLTSPRTLFMVAVAVLTLFGLVMVFSASSIELIDDGRNPFQELMAQARFIAIGLVAAAILVRVPYQFWLGKMLIVLWLATLVMLGATLVVGTEGLGATRWLYIGSFGLQPSEFAKILVILVAARIVTALISGEITLQRFFLLVALGVVVPFALILLEKDLGTLIILATALICMMLLTDWPRWWAVVAFLLLAVLAAIMIATAGYRSSRFSSWLTDPFDYTNTENYYGQGWQVRHSLFAFSSGGFFGVGLGNSRQKYSYLPEAENDFVFAVIGEELGLLGTLFVVGMFCLLGWAGLRIARQATDEAGKLLAGGLTCCLLIQALVNMCGVLRILPLTGRPLPFISAGGSSMLATYIMVGLILSVANVTRREQREAPARRSRTHANLRVVEGGGSAPLEDTPSRPQRPRRRGTDDTHPDPQTREARNEHRGDSGRRDGRTHQPGAGAGRGAARPRP
ncbi:MAG: cell division protein FtsW [Coriobacteriia bacterium]|nr:cell division protein FtsW [Coriobacteriia bacterium]